MCTLVAKKFTNIGWVGVKNRDRPFSTKTDLLRTEKNNIQRVALLDERTHWSEGMNSHGVSIISSRLSPDSKSTAAKLHDSNNGSKIRDALSQPTVEDAVHSLKTSRATGCILVFDADTMYVLEGEYGTRNQRVKEIKDNIVARTNHGILLPTAGYQRTDKDLSNHIKRIGSEARLMIANYIGQVAETPEELMTLMAKKWTDNPQITTLRHADDLIPVRTTEQLMIEPKRKLLLVRNTDGILDFDQKSANPPGSQILVGIVD